MKTAKCSPNYEVKLTEAATASMQSMSGSLKTGFFSLNFSNIVEVTMVAYCANFLRKPVANAVKHRTASAHTLILASFSKILSEQCFQYLNTALYSIIQQNTSPYSDLFKRRSTAVIHEIITSLNSGYLFSEK